MALKQLHLNDGNKTPIEPVISNDSIADNMITLNKLAEPVTTEAEMTLFETNVNNRISALEDNKQDTIDGKVTSFKNGTKFTGNLTLSLPNNTDLQVEGKGLKQYISDNIPPSTGGGGGAGVQLSAPNTATNGIITQGQLTTLQESDLNYIIFNNEIYSLNDKTHTTDTLTYSHVGFENGKHLLKTISITVSTRAWVLNTTEVSSGGSGGTQLYEYTLNNYTGFNMRFITYHNELFISKGDDGESLYLDSILVVTKDYKQAFISEYSNPGVPYPAPRAGYRIITFNVITGKFDNTIQYTNSEFFELIKGCSGWDKPIKL